MRKEKKIQSRPDITMIFTYGYEGDIFQNISFLHVQRSKVGVKLDKFGRKSKKKKLNPVGLVWFAF